MLSKITRDDDAVRREQRSFQAHVAGAEGFANGGAGEGGKDEAGEDLYPVTWSWTLLGR